MFEAAPDTARRCGSRACRPSRTATSGCSVRPPITCVTAIASPTARPMPSRTAATRPPRVNGMITPRTISQRVSPRPYAPSFRSGGTLLKSSRLMLAVIGTIMIVRIRIAGEHVAAAWSAACPKSGIQPNHECRNGSTCGADERAEHEDPPEAEHDARDRRQHLDQRADHAADRRRRELGQEQRDRDRERTGDQDGREGGDRGPVEEVERAELARDRVPVLVPDEREAERLDRGPGAGDHPVDDQRRR